VALTDEYLERLREREASLARFDRLHARIGSARLGVAASFLIVAWFCFGRLAFPVYLILLPALAFLGLLLYHQRVAAQRIAARRGADFYRAGLARMQDQWRGGGVSGEQFAMPHHIYAADLDLFGRGSLFELLCAARTPLGQSTLARWLSAPAELDAIRARQICIDDLRGRLDLREALATRGEASLGLNPQTLVAWSETPNRLNRVWIRWTAPLLAGLALATLTLWVAAGIRDPFLALLTGEILLAYFLRESIQQALSTLERAYEDIKGLSLLLQRLEAEQFEAAPLRAMVGALASHAQSASDTFSQLATIVNLVESRRNPLLAPLLLLVMYPLQAALAAERWRSKHGRVIERWLQVLGEIEALISLARFAYEHPEYPFPEFLEGAAAFKAVALAHPLLAAERRIANDLDVSAQIRVLLVSGSNMSGKSTLLRAVGTNTVLAMAGAPVCAQRLQLTPLQVGASIRVNDSLHEGSSRFYAEITRLRQLFEPSALPLLALLDELLQGTNSTDRRIGAHGIIRALIARGAIGLVSTHDLALNDDEGLGEDVLQNVHFQDELKDGKLQFDFKLHPGVVTKSNGVELMRSIGLKI
jgi:hypothetical protein